MDTHHGFILSFNGAYLMDCQSETLLYGQPINAEMTTLLLEHLKQYDVIPMVSDDRYMYISNVFGGMIDTSQMFNEPGHKTNII